MQPPLHLFEKFGIEIEYMIVDNDTGRVAPLAGDVMEGLCGTPACDATVGDCAVSNELAAHIVELKCPFPTTDLAGLERNFSRAINIINEVLQPHSACLLPGPMHPSMDPATESGIWGHEGSEIYALYDSIFGCRNHGWLNLQSCHLNLPFANEREFGLLHAAVILILPFLPALSAGSPFRNRETTGFLDTRIHVYRVNQVRCPAITGLIVPEPVYTEIDYRNRILHPMYEQVAPYDPAGTLKHEWLNSRGAIARFDRGAIEIRVLDAQECPAADVAICDGIIAVLRNLVETRGDDLLLLAARSSTKSRRNQLLETAARGFAAPLLLAEIPDAFDLQTSPSHVGGFWEEILSRGLHFLSPDSASVLASILEHGNLAERMLRWHRESNDPSDFWPLLRELSTCLAENRLFRPDQLS